MMFFPNYERVFFWQPLLIYLFFLIYQKRKRKEKKKRVLKVHKLSFLIFLVDVSASFLNFIEIGWTLRFSSGNQSLVYFLFYLLMSGVCVCLIAPFVCSLCTRIVPSFVVF